MKERAFVIFLEKSFDRLIIILQHSNLIRRSVCYKSYTERKMDDRQTDGGTDIQTNRQYADRPIDKQVDRAINR